MRWFPRSALGAALLTVAACQSAPGEGGVHAAPDGPRTLVMHRRVVDPAEGSDQRPLYTLAWRTADGRVEPIALDHPVMHAVALGDVIYMVDGEHRLHRRDSDTDEVIAEGVFARPVVEGHRLAYVSGPPGAQELRWRHADGPEHAVSTELYQLGVLRFAPAGEAVLGVGSADGGVAGVQVVPLDGSAVRCLTNCQLRTGEPWPDGEFIPSPGAADGFRFDGPTVEWDTVAGPVTRRWGAP